MHYNLSLSVVYMQMDGLTEYCITFTAQGWVQELDGDPGEASSWYRGKTNIAATESDFQSLGLKMYVYTNTDNC